MTETRATPPALHLEGLHIRRGDVEIVTDLNWRIESGQCWALIGPNGCGKTSLLSVLTGFLQASQGRIHVLGKTYGTYDWRKMRQRIGVVSSALRQMIVADESAIETVASGKRAMLDFRVEEMTPEEKTRAAEILERVGAAALTNRPWRVLSQGERQRVLIGRALMADPALLILDEPCAGLDPVARETFLAQIQAIGAMANAPSMILVTHHVEEITPIFSHALILANGRVEAAGPIEETLTDTNLSQAFRAKIQLRNSHGRYAIDQIQPLKS